MSNRRKRIGLSKKQLAIMHANMMRTSASYRWRYRIRMLPILFVATLAFVKGLFVYSFRRVRYEFAIRRLQSRARRRAKGAGRG